MSGETIDLKAAARQLGVHYQTAYRWVRAGALPASVVQGTYRLECDAVARFAEQRARPRRPRPGRPRTDRGELRERLHEHLVAGEERRASRLVAGLTDRGVPLTEIARDLLVPSLREIGDAWRAGQLDIATEHRASGIVERMLGQSAPHPRGRRRGAVAVAALAGDRHVLPTTLAAIALREDNWRVHHLGADLPVEELLRFTRREPVDLVVLTVTLPKLARPARRVAAQLESAGLPVLVGGPGRSLEELQHAARELPGRAR